MEREFKVGDIVKSTSGHDKNQLFLIISIDKNGYIVIINGKQRTKNKPKLKNPKHLQLVAHDENLLKTFNSRLSTDTEIHKLIKKHNLNANEN